MRDGYIATEDGAQLYFREMGSGATTVLVPDAAFLCEHLGWLAERHTVIFYDVRNRGRSQSIEERERLARGIHQDVDDLETVRRHFGLDNPQLIGHSYWGAMVLLHALAHGHAERIVQIGAPPPDASRQYPQELQWRDQVSLDFAAAVANLQVQRHLRPAAELRTELLAWLRRLMVLDSANVSKLRWNVAELPNEATAFVHFHQNIEPTLQGLRLDAQQLSKVSVPVLTIHARQDRQAPYGGGRDWAAWLPNARLLTIEQAAHVPWIEAPEEVFGALETFLQGEWPETARAGSLLR